MSRYSVKRVLKGWHRPVNYAPALYPFEPDSSLPDFAHDDAHIAAIGAANNGRGFPHPRPAEQAMRGSEPQAHTHLTARHDSPCNRTNPHSGAEGGGS